MKPGMTPLVLLVVPLAAAFILGSLYGPAVQALNPGNELMTASNGVIQSDTFALVGSAGSLMPSGSDRPSVVTGSWGLDVRSGNVSAFYADLSMINADGSGYKTIRLANVTASRVDMHDNGTATIEGTVGVAVNDTGATQANMTISVAKLRAITIVLDPENVTGTFAGNPVYGIVDQPELESASAPMQQETGIGLNNITEKMRLPELPNPFK